MLEITPIPAFHDNYIWLITEGNHAVVVDPGDASPVIAYLQRERLSLSAILITHHHRDHTGGVAQLLASAAAPLPVYGPAAESIPGLTHPLSQGDRITPPDLGCEFQVLDIPGHTAGHIAFFAAPDGIAPVLFCGDTLFSGGCGRLFEGSPEQMQASLDKLAALPAASRIYCAHEYTLANLRFAIAVEPGNAELRRYLADVEHKRAQDRITLPSTVQQELLINPFLRSDQQSVRDAAETFIGRSLNSRTEVFATVRSWKDNF